MHVDSGCSVANLHAATIHKGNSAASGWTYNWVDLCAIIAFELIVWLFVVSIGTASSLLFVWTYSRGKGCLIHTEVMDDMRWVVVETRLWVFTGHWTSHLDDRLGRVVRLSLAHGKTDTLSIVYGDVLDEKIGWASPVIIWLTIACYHAAWSRR